MTNFERVSESIAAAGGDPRNVEESMRDRLTKHGAFVQFLPFVRRASITEKFGRHMAQPMIGATLRDDQGGAEYDVVLDERGRPTYFAVRAIDGALTGIDEWPRDHVALLVRQHLRREETGDLEADILQRDDARHASNKSRRPSNEYIGELIREAHAAGVSPQTVVRAQTGNNSSSVDRWIAEARKADRSLPQATRRGRRRSNTTGSEA